jgi:hypothetical protein
VLASGRARTIPVATRHSCEAHDARSVHRAPPIDGPNTFPDEIGTSQARMHRGRLHVPTNHPTARRNFFTRA